MHLLIVILTTLGPYSVDVVRYVRSLNAHCVRGNHDEHALFYAMHHHEITKKPKYSYVTEFTA